MKAVNIRRLCFIVLVIAMPVLSKEKPKATRRKPDAPRTPKVVHKQVQLETIEIKGKIQEPTLLYILDQPNFEIEPYEESVDFLPKIQGVIRENQL